MTRPSALETSRRGSAREQAIRTSSSDSDRPKVGKNSRLGEGRSPRGVPANQGQKKLGTRIADLESQLGLAHEELKCLKDQLASTDTAKKAAAQGHVEKRTKKQQKSPEPFAVEEKHSALGQSESDGQVSKRDSSSIALETNDEVVQETDVFEVSIEKVAVEPKAELVSLPRNEDELEPKAVDISTELATVLGEENPLVNELASKDNEINLLKANLSEKEKEMELIRKENESLRSQLDEKSLKVSLTQSEIDELTSRLSGVLQELEESKSNAARVNERLEAADKARGELENEMTKLRVQTDQWRKAADAAASVLAGGVEMNGRRISERCGSMDTHVFERVGGYASYVGSPGMNDDCEYGFGSERRKGSGIRLLGDLWKKKVQK